MILLTHPLGNANVRQAALAFAEAGMLEEFCTCLHWKPDGSLARVLPARLRAEFERRAVPPSVGARATTAATARELGRHVLGRFTALPGTRWLTRHERGPFSIDAVFREFDRAVAEKIRRLPTGSTVRGVYAYEDGAASTFRAAAERGLRRLYDLPIGYWRAGQKIFAEEAERQLAWAPTLTGRADSAGKLARKDEELAAADAIFVASSFTSATLAEAPAFRAPVHVVPYGAPDPIAGEPPRVGREAGEPLRVLFAGALGQRKGLSYLLEAVASLGPRAVTLTLLGQKTVVAGCAPLDAAVRAHRWIPSLPHAAVLEEMTRHDVLVFPSLFEGFGLVIAEAMSCGLAVIASTHTAAPDLFSADSAEGFLVPVRSAEAIAGKLETLHRDRSRLAEMRRAALARAATLRWDNYRRELRAHVLATRDAGARAAS